MMFMRLSRLLKLISLGTLCLLMAVQHVKAEPSMFVRQPQTHSPKVDFADAIRAGTFVERSSSSTYLPRGSCSLPAPTLTSPVNDIQVNTLIPYFQWNGTETDSYYIQVSTFSDFSNTTFDIRWSGFSGVTNVSVLFESNLSPDTTYYWRVASVCSDLTIGIYSNTAAFKTANIIGPFLDPPVMTAPMDGAMLSSLDVVFSRENVPGAEACQLRIYLSLSDAQSDDPWSAIWWSGWYTEVTNTFDTAGTYYWRVLARDTIAWGSLSLIRSFTIGVPNQPFELYLPLIENN